jgi:hypothetical protein
VPFLGLDGVRLLPQSPELLPRDEISGPDFKQQQKHNEADDNQA